MAFHKAPQLIFGCGGLGNEIVGQDKVTELLQMLKEGGVERLDTAALYPPTDIGASQRLLGEVGAARKGFTIDTKVLIALSGFKSTLRPEKIAQSVAESEKALGFGENQRINVYYPHAPDVATPLKDQAYGFDVEHKKGKFSKVRTAYSMSPASRDVLTRVIARSVQLPGPNAGRTHRDLRARRIRQAVRVPRHLQPHRSQA